MSIRFLPRERWSKEWYTSTARAHGQLWKGKFPRNRSTSGAWLVACTSNMIIRQSQRMQRLKAARETSYKGRTRSKRPLRKKKIPGAAKVGAPGVDFQTACLLGALVLLASPRIIHHSQRNKKRELSSRRAAGWVETTGGWITARCRVGGKILSFRSFRLGWMHRVDGAFDLCIQPLCGYILINFFSLYSLVLDMRMPDSVVGSLRVKAARKGREGRGWQVCLCLAATRTKNAFSLVRTGKWLRQINVQKWLVRSRRFRRRKTDLSLFAPIFFAFSGAEDQAGERKNSDVSKSTSALCKWKPSRRRKLSTRFLSPFLALFRNSRCIFVSLCKSIYRW